MKKIRTFNKFFLAITCRTNSVYIICSWNFLMQFYLACKCDLWVLSLKIPYCLVMKSKSLFAIQKPFWFVYGEFLIFLILLFTDLWPSTFTQIGINTPDVVLFLPSSDCGRRCCFSYNLVLVLRFLAVNQCFCTTHIMHWGFSASKNQWDSILLTSWSWELLIVSISSYRFSNCFQGCSE